MKKVMLYFHLNPVTGVVFYVGIGLRSRYLDKTHRNPYWNNYVSKYGFRAVVIQKNLTQAEAIKKEIYWIKLLGRKDKGFGELVNLTDGGEGAFGAIRSKETKEKMSIAAKKIKRYPLTAEHKANISKGHLGKKHNDQHRLNNSLSKKLAHATNPNMGMNGRVCSEETKRKIGAANAIIGKGRRMSEEAKLKMSIYRTGRKLSEETKKKISIANAGLGKGRKLPEETRLKMCARKTSDETKKKLSEAGKRYWQLKVA